MRTGLFLLFLLLFAATSPFGRPAPELRGLFVPPHAEPWRYDLFVSADPIDVLVQRLKTVDVVWPVGAWTIERQEPFEAFGADGRYDRFRLMWLFGGNRPRVARGPIIQSGRSIGSVTLISPYPDREMKALVPGTLAILVYVRMPTATGLDPQGSR